MKNYGCDECGCSFELKLTCLPNKYIPKLQQASTFGDTCYNKSFQECTEVVLSKIRCPICNSENFVEY